jgi:hypothetical protein
VQVHHEARVSNPLLQKAQYRCFDKLSIDLASSYASTTSDVERKGTDVRKNERKSIAEVVGLEIFPIDVDFSL